MISEDEIKEIFDRSPLSEFLIGLSKHIRTDLIRIQAAAELMNSEQALKMKYADGYELDLVQIVIDSAEHARDVLVKVAKHADILEGRAGKE